MSTLYLLRNMLDGTLVYVSGSSNDKSSWKLFLGEGKTFRQVRILAVKEIRFDNFMIFTEEESLWISRSVGCKYGKAVLELEDSRWFDIRDNGGSLTITRKS